MSPMPQARPGALTTDDIAFAVLTCVAVVVAHAIAYMTHEYSHSFMAWALGWMPKPLALDYGPATLSNILFLGDVSDNVQYDPIFAAGHGLAASTIALSGLFFGNVVIYIALARISRSTQVSSSRIGMSAVYWMALMCAGNVWSYVPIRALTSHADIALTAKGLGISTWTLFPFLIVPALYVAYHFFCRMVPRCTPAIAAGSGATMVFIIALTSYWFFALFGGAAIDGSYGLLSQLLSIVSRVLLFPVAVLWLTHRTVRSPVA